MITARVSTVVTLSLLLLPNCGTVPSAEAPDASEPAVSPPTDDSSGAEGLGYAQGAINAASSPGEAIPTDIDDLTSTHIIRTVTRTGTVCAQVPDDFVDKGGEYWTDFSPRPAKGFKFTIVDETGSFKGWLRDTDGCEEVTVSTKVGGSFDFRVHSKATVSGVEIHSWYGANEWSKQFSRQDRTVPTPGMTPTFSQFMHTIDVAGAQFPQSWRNLIVATQVFRGGRTWNVNIPVSRDCCYDEDGPNDDGTCPGNRTYSPVGTPLQMQNHEDAGSGSTLRDFDGDGVQTGTPGVEFRSDGGLYRRKFTIAHEIGHVIVGMRMNGRASKDATAPLDGCNGDMDGTGTYIDQDERGTFGKDYLSAALREGWADYVAAVAFNRTNEGICELQTFKHGKNFDLSSFNQADNRDVDASGNQNDLHGTYYCDRAPLTAHHENLSGPLLWEADAGWLRNAIANVSSCTSAGSSALDSNRSSIYDVARLFWDLDAEEGLGAQDLSNLYVNMCPLTWDSNDHLASNNTTEKMPRKRLQKSALALGLWSTVLRQMADHIDH